MANESNKKGKIERLAEAFKWAKSKYMLSERVKIKKEVKQLKEQLTDFVKLRNAFLSFLDNSLSDCKFIRFRFSEDLDNETIRKLLNDAEVRLNYSIFIDRLYDNVHDNSTDFIDIENLVEFSKVEMIEHMSEDLTNTSRRKEVDLNKYVYIASKETLV